jgi:L-2-hydroxyglutarate oxidase LhgO
MDTDVVVIGAGVVGLACAAESAMHGLRTVIVEKHESFGMETSSRNSEVIHSGIYYPTGSLKARLCVQANKNLYSECERLGVWTRKCGKLIVAVTSEEIRPLEKLYARGIENGIDGMQILDAHEAKKLEPSITCSAAIFLPSTGILDSHELMKSYLTEAKGYGADVVFNITFLAAERKHNAYRVTLKDSRAETINIETRYVINSAGLHADKVASSIGIDIDKAGYRLHHNRGHYYAVSHAKSKMISRLVYPLPHEKLVTVGIHITVDRSGKVKLGPDMEYLDPSIPESDWYIFDESRREFFYGAVKHYFPLLELGDLSPDQVGVRPKLTGSEKEIKDFIIREEINMGLLGVVNLIGIESPGLTCAREIAREVFRILKSNHSEIK